jgi:carboxypeptidase T
MVNPDGHEYARTRIGLAKPASEPGWQFGIDQIAMGIWGTLNVSTSSHVQHETYVGPYAFSEPETRAARPYRTRTLSRRHYLPQFATYPYPWGHTSRPIAAPADHNQMAELAKRMQQLIQMFMM